jgi:hypothetical protein
MLTTSVTYPWSFVTQISIMIKPSDGGDRKTFEVMTSAYERVVQPVHGSREPLKSPIA